LIGTTYGDGNGTSTFNLPDLRGRVALGVGEGPGLSAYELADDGGEESVALGTSQMPEHSHVMVGVDSDSETNTPSGTTALAVSTSGNIYVAQEPAVPLRAGTVSNAGEGAAHENRQPYLALRYIISVGA
jgi:microcystin-dependent protein